MRAVVYDRPNEFTLRDVTEPALAPGDVRLRVVASGVCGTDQHIHEGGFGVRFPATPGHEMVGEVVEAHPSVAEPRAGEFVVVDNVLTCGRCDQCQQGRVGLCRNLEAYGLTAQGSVAETIVVAASTCIPIGDLSPEIAVLAEPLACVIHGMDVLQLRPAADVLVVGAGPTGQLLTQTLVRGGASRVVVAAPTEAKLGVARRHGATETVITDRGDFAASYRRLRELAPHGFDVVIDATGASGVLNALLPMVRDGGTMMIYGMASEDVQLTVSPYEIFRRELTIKGSFAQTNCLSRAVSMLRHGVVSADGIITHRFPLEQYADALQALRDPACLKAVVVP
ncbi:zinc-dependent alcohol dehydrogenase family protein [Microbacterium keratanolyticum]